MQIGKEGVSDSAVAALEEAFNTRELLKVKVQETAPLPARDVGELLAARVSGVQVVQTIGRTVVLFRPHPERPEIRLPG